MLILRNGEPTTILKRHKHGSRRQPALQNLSTQRSDGDDTDTAHKKTLRAAGRHDWQLDSTQGQAVVRSRKFSSNCKCSLACSYVRCFLLLSGAALPQRTHRKNRHRSDSGTRTPRTRNSLERTGFPGTLLLRMTT